MTLLAVVLAPLFVTPGAVALFLVTSAVTLCAGHSIGLHRLLIHRNLSAAPWLERVLVYLGTLVGMAGPIGMVRLHDTRDWAQRQTDCHDLHAHRATMLRDAWWQMHCRLILARPPVFVLEPALAKSRFLGWLEATWMLQQLPLAAMFYGVGGMPWLIWGVPVRIAVSVTGHWLVGHVTHRRGPQGWAVDGVAVQGHDLPLAALLTFGESWHGNHHAWPDSARLGIEPGQPDPGWWFLLGLRRLGLVWDLREPSTLAPRAGLRRIAKGGMVGPTQRSNRMRLIAIIVAAAFTAAPAFSADLTGTLQKVKETGTITLGVRDASVPFSYLDENQKPVGFAIDICMKIVDAVKAELNMPALKVETLAVTSSNRIPLMANGTIDLECGSTTNNVERQKQVAFTNTHFLTASVLVAKKSAGISMIDDLKGKPVASTAGSTNIVQLNKANAAKSLGVTVLPAKDHPEGFLMVETGRAVAFVMDDVIISNLIASAKNPADYAIGAEAFSAAEPYGIMLRRDDAPFKALADRATAALYQSPEIVKLYAKWFQSPIPPRGLNFNLPMNPALRNEFAHPSDNPDPASYTG